MVKFEAEELMPKLLPPLTLTADDRTYLQSYVRTGQRSARAIKRAQILLQSDAGGSVAAIS